MPFLYILWTEDPNHYNADMNVIGVYKTKENALHALDKCRDAKEQEEKHEQSEQSESNQAEAAAVATTHSNNLGRKRKYRQYVDNIPNVGDDHLLREYCGYQHESKLNLSTIELQQRDTTDQHLYLLKLEEDGGGGSYHSCISLFVYQTFQELQQEAKDIIRTEHQPETDSETGEPRENYCDDCAALGFAMCAELLWDEFAYKKLVSFTPEINRGGDSITLEYHKYTVQ